MPARFMQANANIAGTSEGSILRFPSSGRSAGRIDSILVAVDYMAAYPGVAGFRDSELRVYIDDPATSPSVDYQITFEEAARVSDSGLEIVKFLGSATRDWAFVIRFRGLFRYYFDVRMYNAVGASQDFHTTVFFEEF